MWTVARRMFRVHVNIIIDELVELYQNYRLYRVNLRFQGKIKLEGTAAQRVDQLDRRETELLEELSKSKQLCSKLKKDKVEYRKKLEEKE